MKNLLLSTIFLFFTLSTHAQSFLDSSFGTDGIVLATLLANSGFNALAIQPDNKIIAVGRGDTGQTIIIRYLENGSLDNSFAAGGIFNDIYESGVSAVVLQPDGKIVTEGTGIGALGPFMLTIRLNINGSLDTTFGIGGIVSTNFVTGSADDGISLALQADGKIVIVGSDNETYVGLIRLLPNGILDSSFGDTGIVITNTAGKPVGVFIMPDGRIVVGGELYFDGMLLAMRLLANGQLDTSFNHTGVAATIAGDSYNSGRTALLQPNGKVVVGGVGTFGAAGNDFALIRYNVNGSLDRSFGDTGVVNIDFNMNDDEIHALAIDSNGNIEAAGSAVITVHSEFAMASIDSNGNIDSSFGINGRITTNIQDSFDAAQAIAIQTDGKIILAGNSYNNSGAEMAIARYQNVAESVQQVASNLFSTVLYPNPTSCILTISNTDHIVDITACDILGNKIPINVNLPGKEIYTNNLASGIYFFTLSYNDRPPITQKIQMKMHD